MCYVVCGVVFLIIVTSLFSGCGYVPYVPTNLFSHQYPYEGYANMGTDYSSNPGHGTMDSYNSFLIDGSKAGNCKKVYGFDGLFCEPGVADNKIDSFADTPGSLSCFGKSSGLTNSKGSLCLTDTQKTLLSTRGGNQTGAPSSLG
jgi:hypothetical protein